MGLPVKVDEKQLVELSAKAKKQEESKLFELNGESIDLGQSNTLRYAILSNVLEEKYDAALQELKVFRQAESIYPNFKQKVERLLAHCLDLIYAIKAKRNFPGLSSLTRPKQ